MRKLQENGSLITSCGCAEEFEAQFADELGRVVKFEYASGRGPDGEWHKGHAIYFGWRTSQDGEDGRGFLPARYCPFCGVEIENKKGGLE